jgi:transposase
MKIEENDIAYSVHHMVTQIPDQTFSSFVRETGCPAYHPRDYESDFVYLHAIRFFW